MVLTNEFKSYILMYVKCQGKCEFIELQKSFKSKFDIRISQSTFRNYIQELIRQEHLKNLQAGKNRKIVIEITEDGIKELENYKVKINLINQIFDMAKL